MLRTTEPGGQLAPEPGAADGVAVAGFGPAVDRAAADGEAAAEAVAELVALPLAEGTELREIPFPGPGVPLDPALGDEVPGTPGTAVPSAVAGSRLVLLAWLLLPPPEKPQ